MKEIIVDAVIDNLDTVTEFVNELLEQNDCPMKVQMQINIAIDELFSNIAQYAYSDGIGKATVRVEMQDAPKAVCITFIDCGIPYNPLEKVDPDITLSAEERKIGGLGIFMVKQQMDEITYDYRGGYNQLLIKKYFD